MNVPRNLPGPPGNKNVGPWQVPKYSTELALQKELKCEGTEYFVMRKNVIDERTSFSVFHPFKRVLPLKIDKNKIKRQEVLLHFCSEYLFQNFAWLYQGRLQYEIYGRLHCFGGKAKDVKNFDDQIRLPLFRAEYVKREIRALYMSSQMFFELKIVIRWKVRNSSIGQPKLTQAFLWNHSFL